MLARLTLGQLTLARLTLARLTRALARLTLARLTLARMTLALLILAWLNLARLTLARPTLARLTLARLILARMTLSWLTLALLILRLSLAWLNMTQLTLALLTQARLALAHWHMAQSRLLARLTLARLTVNRATRILVRPTLIPRTRTFASLASNLTLGIVLLTRTWPVNPVLVNQAAAASDNKFGSAPAGSSALAYTVRLTLYRLAGTGSGSAIPLNKDVAAVHDDSAEPMVHVFGAAILIPAGTSTSINTAAIATVKDAGDSGSKISISANLIIAPTIEVIAANLFPRNRLRARQRIVPPAIAGKSRAPLGKAKAPAAIHSRLVMSTAAFIQLHCVYAVRVAPSTAA
jgi:hypothetical protein